MTVPSAPTRRLVTWNVLEGLLRRVREGAPEREPDPPRVAAARALVNRLGADILILNEALHCEEAFGLLVDHAALFDYPHAVARLYDASWGNAILARHPILAVEEMVIHRPGSLQNRGALAVKLALPEGELWVATHHPHPHRRPAKRAEDFANFLSRLDGRVLLAGDLNAISPGDATDRDALVRAFERFSRPGDAAPAVDRFLEAGRLLFDEVLPRAGLRDAIPPERRAPTMPTALLGPDRSSGMRIDHILASTGIDAVDGGPVRDAEADVASDHYPVTLDFRLVPPEVGA